MSARWIVLLFAATAAAGWSQTVEDKPNHWSYTPPKGFVRDDNAPSVPKGNVAFFAPREHNYTPNILVVSGGVGKETAKSLGMATVKAAKEDKAINVLSEGTLKLGENEAYTWRMTRKMGNGITIGQRLVVFVKSGRGVFMTLSAPLETMDAWDKSFAVSTKTFIWK